MAVSLFKSRSFMLSLLVLIALPLLWLVQRGDSFAADKPLLATVARATIENTVSAAGSLAPSNSVEVGAQVSGQLEELLVEVGDKVQEGQLVARIDASVQMQEVEARRASLLAQEAQLSGREAALKLAEANAARQQSMMKEKATSQQEVDDAINTLISAQSSLAQLQAQIQQSRASLASAETELGYSNIYAPMSGTVVSISIKEGQTLNANQSAPTVLTIADLSSMTVETNVSEADVNKLRPSMEVYFTTLGGGSRRWHSTLRQILPTPVVTNNVVLYTALFDVDNQDSALLSGMTAQVFFITSAARDVLTVPVAALTDTATPLTASGVPKDKPARQPGEDRARPVGNGEWRGKNMADGSVRPPRDASSESPRARRNDAPNSRRSKAIVKVAGANGAIEEREVIIGIRSRVLAEVVSGLEAGEQVVAGVVQNTLALAQDDDERRGPPMRGFR